MMNMALSALVCMVLCYLQTFNVASLSSLCTIGSDNKTADCSNMQLTSVLDYLPPGIEHLDLTLNDPLINCTADSFARYPSLRTLRLSDTKMETLDINCFQRLQELRELYITDSDFLLNIIDTNMTSLPNLQVLDIRHNEITYISAGLLGRAFNHLQVLNLSLNDLGEGGTLSGIFDGCHSLVDLQLASNDIAKLDPDFLTDCHKLTRLSLEDNDISTFNINLPKYGNLVYISLSKNKIQQITQPMRELLQSFNKPVGYNPTVKHLLHEHGSRLDGFELDLTNNPLQCKCDTLSFMKWMLTTRINLTDIDELLCYSANGSQQKLSNFYIEELESHCTIGGKITKAAVILCCSSLIILLVILLSYKFRWHLRWKYHKIKLMLSGGENHTPSSNSFRYDAFIAFNHEENIGWVKNVLLVKAEREMGYKLCVGQRDWDVGDIISECIVESVETSRKVILVITPAFVQSRWCDFEMNMALVNKDLQDIIIIYLEPVEQCRRISRTLKSLLKNKLYLKWTNNSDGQLLFWGKLDKALRNNNPNAMSSIRTISGTTLL